MDNLHRDRHRRRHRDPRRFIAQERRQVRSKWLFYIFATTTLMLTLPFAFTLTLAIHFNSSIFIVDCFYTAFFTFVSCSAVMLFAKYSQIDLTLYAPRRLTTTLTVLSLSTTYYALVGFFCLRMRHDTQHTQIHKSAFSVFFTILIMVPFIMGTSSLPILCLLELTFYSQLLFGGRQLSIAVSFNYKTCARMFSFRIALLYVNILVPVRNLRFNL